MTSDFDDISGKYEDSISLINSLDDWIYKINLPKNKNRLLDIGCGTGLLLKTLSKKFNTSYGIDNSKEMIKIAKEKYPNLNFICADANVLNFEDNFFDMVVSHTTFHHLDRVKAVSEVKRVLKNNGKLVIVDVSIDLRKWPKKLQKILLRNLYSTLKLKWMYGNTTSKKAWEYLAGPVWRQHRQYDIDNNLDFNFKQTREFYKNHLPGCKIILINFFMEAIIWTKH